MTEIYPKDKHEIIRQQAELAKDPFKLNNFEDSILQELMIKVKNELINSN